MAGINMNEKGSFSIEGLICSLIFSFFIIYLSMFSKIMFVQSVVDDVLAESAKKMAIVTPVDKYGALGKIGFNFAFDNIFVNELKSKGYTLDSLDIEELNLNYSDYGESKNLGLLSAEYKIDCKLNGLRNIKDTRNLIFSKIQFDLDFKYGDKLGNTVYITNTGIKYHQ